MTLDPWALTGLKKSNPAAAGSSIATVFFGSILWCSQSGDHPKEDLAKFGYYVNMTVKKIILLYFWLPTWTMYRNGVIFKKIGRILANENLQEKQLILDFLNFEFLFLATDSQEKNRLSFSLALLAI